MGMALAAQVLHTLNETAMCTHMLSIRECVLDGIGPLWVGRGNFSYSNTSSCDNPTACSRSNHNVLRRL
jgi:hypothetical protein